MSFHSLRRHSRFGIATAVASAVLAACGGSSSPDVIKGADTTEDGGVGSSNGSDGGAPTSTSSSGAADSSAGKASSNGSDSGSVTVTPADGAACPANGNEVVMVGDSYFALSEMTSPPAGEITEHLQSLASAAGALAPGDTYRHYYESGANMATTYVGSTITPIPTQFANAVTAGGDIKYVIMDGGGNDILLENTGCIIASPDAGISSTCETAVQNALTAATTLFQTMKTAGVQKIIYFFYPHLPTTHYPAVNAMLDYAYPLVAAACANAPIPCYFIDTRPAFDGKDATYIGPDDIHPTTAGADVIAGLIWNEMQQQCVALSP